MTLYFYRIYIFILGLPQILRFALYNSLNIDSYFGGLNVNTHGLSRLSIFATNTYSQTFTQQKIKMNLRYTLLYGHYMQMKLRLTLNHLVLSKWLFASFRMCLDCSSNMYIHLHYGIYRKFLLTFKTYKMLRNNKLLIL